MTTPTTAAGRKLLEVRAYHADWCALVTGCTCHLPDAILATEREAADTQDARDGALRECIRVIGMLRSFLLSGETLQDADGVVIQGTINAAREALETRRG